MFANLVRSGSKGSVVNLAQVVACVGQQSNTGIAGADTRTSYHTDDRARLSGFCQSSFYQGLNPIEFFNHTVSGREGLIDTAVKTSSTGYVQRRIIKSMEPVSVAYDLTVRRGANPGRAAALRGQRPVLRAHETGAAVGACRALRGKVLAAHGEADGDPHPPRCEVARNHKVFRPGGDPLLCPFDANALGRRKPGASRQRQATGPRSKQTVGRFVGCSAAGAALVVELCLLCAFSERRAQPPRRTVSARPSARKSVGTSPRGPGEKHRHALLGQHRRAHHADDPQLGGLQHPSWWFGSGRPEGVSSTSGCIGAVVDALMDAAKPGRSRWHPNDTAYLPLAPGAAEALTVDEDGRASWEALEAVTRHPPINKDGSRTLLKVTTQSGRSVSLPAPRASWW